MRPEHVLISLETSTCCCLLRMIILEMDINVGVQDFYDDSRRCTWTRTDQNMAHALNVHDNDASSHPRHN